MSLIHRVTSIDGTDREPPQADPKELGYGTARSLRRVISYDVIAAPAQDSQATHPHGHTTQYKVSTAKRLAQVIITIVSCWLASGIVFGFAALKPVLIDTGVYREYCTREELEEGVKLCYEQDLRLNVFFAVASTTCNMSALLVGAILDRYGPRVAGMIGSLALAIGSALMVAAFELPGFDGYIAGNIFLSLGGTFIFVPSFQVANAFPKYAGTIVAMVTGAFDASAAVFLFFRLAYEATGGAFTPQKFFLAYLIVPALLLIAQFTIMNEEGYKTLPELELKIERARDATQDVHDSDEELSDGEAQRLRNRRRERRQSNLERLEELVGDAEERKMREEKHEERLATSGVWGALHGKSVREQMLSPWFIFITLLTALQMLRMNFFIATISSQYEYMLGSKGLAREVNAFFDIALPIGGVAATPFIGLLLDHVSTATLLAGLVALITAVGVSGSLPFLWAAYANVVLFVLLRPLYYSAMSDYAAKVFGFATFGRVYGMIICISGLINLTQPLIDAANHDIFHDNPIPINVVLSSLGFILGVALVVYVWSEGRKFERRVTKNVRVNERSQLLPEVIEEEY